DGVIYNKEERLNLLEQVGNFSTNPSLLIKKILKAKNILPGRKVVVKDTAEQKKKVSEKKKIIIGGEKDLPYRLGRCCNKKITNEVVAHINGKGIITIHKRDCEVLEDVNKKRLLSAYIEGKEDESIIFEIELLFVNKIGVLKELSDIIFSMGIDVNEINSENIGKYETKISLKLNILDYDYLIMDRFIERLKLNFKSGLISSVIGKIKKNEDIDYDEIKKIVNQKNEAKKLKK
ncbi:MAG: hypothetical protein QM490_03565, partial [Candidatus Gracilibacteria bacterium]